MSNSAGGCWPSGSGFLCGAFVVGTMLSGCRHSVADATTKFMLFATPTNAVEFRSLFAVLVQTLQAVGIQGDNGQMRALDLFKGRHFNRESSYFACAGIWDSN